MFNNTTMYRCTRIGAALVLWVAGPNTHAVPLGHFPLCEPSAARLIECPDDPSRRCLLIADNEIRDRLFFFQLGQAGSVLGGQRELALVKSNGDAMVISDVEALVRSDDDRIVVFGSHSRNNKCQKRKNRRRFAQLSPDAAGVWSGQRNQSSSIRCKRLFNRQVRRDDFLAVRICRLIQLKEDLADAVEQAFERGTIPAPAAEDLCNEITPYNAEGAVVVPSGSRSNLWVGLRSPLWPDAIDGAGVRRYAILLRQPERDRYRFDAVALIDLGGHGVRELEFHDDTVWVISGPAGDVVGGGFALWRFPAGALVPGTAIHPIRVDALPASAEGLAISGANAYVVIDGVADQAHHRCSTPAGLLILPQSAGLQPP